MPYRALVEEKLAAIEREFRGQLLELFGARMREGLSIADLAKSTGRTERNIRGLLFGGISLSFRSMAELIVALDKENGTVQPADLNTPCDP